LEPQGSQMGFSPSRILVENPEPVELARVSIAYDQFDVLTAYSSDQTRWLILPVDGAKSFAAEGILTLTYRLDIGDARPWLCHGSLTQENVQIPHVRH